MINKNSHYKNYTFYIIMTVGQIILLIVWTITQKGVEVKKNHLEYGNIYYDYIACSHGNEYLVSAIFSIDFILLMLSVIYSYKGRHSNELNFNNNYNNYNNNNNKLIN